ncbi:MAG: hypothetical protein ACD_75C02068G0001 [uncultured bacterium]|nr:MAG: hypothetical protein ACD_75C02068G0001 [uncultured bacterium]
MQRSVEAEILRFLAAGNGLHLAGLPGSHYHRPFQVRMFRLGRKTIEGFGKTLFHLELDVRSERGDNLQTFRL